jgi:hypothetical protein
MLISYEPMSDVLTITLNAAPWRNRSARHRVGWVRCRPVAPVTVAVPTRALWCGSRADKSCDDAANSNRR